MKYVKVHATVDVSEEPDEDDEDYGYKDQNQRDITLTWDSGIVTRKALRFVENTKIVLGLLSNYRCVLTLDESKDRYLLTYFVFKKDLDVFEQLQKYKRTVAANIVEKFLENPTAENCRTTLGLNQLVETR